MLSSRPIAVFLFCMTLSQLTLATPLKGHKMMVATPTPLSAQVAEEIILKKGNVVDVAVGVALALAVTNTRHAALGGGGFAMVKMGKDPIQALDFRETAPKKTHKDYFKQLKSEDSRTGPHGVGVPGIPAGLWALHKKYGKLHWSLLFDTPIRLADKGHPISGENVDRLQRAHKDFNPAGKKHLLKANNELYKPGEIFQQKALGKALKLMRNRGIVPFYNGPIGDDIVKTINEAGGVLSREDLQSYKVRWLKPIKTKFKGHELFLMPPPSSGGLMIASSLQMIELLNLDKFSPLSTLEFHYLIEIMKINFRLRSLLGDPDFVTNPQERFLDKKQARQWTKKIKPNSVLDLKMIQETGPESNETTHFSVMDADGNAVAMTLTLNGIYGSKMVSNKYGIALNNEMDDFTTRPGESNLFGLQQGGANYIEPGKRPLSSMSPTLVAKNGKVMMSLGAPGGPRIISAVLQTLYRKLATDFNIEEAIHAPRVHHQFLPNIVYIDDKKLPPLSIEALKELGHQLEPGWGARVNAVYRNEDNILEAAFDFRSEGGAGGF
jgi:gamma-glutamyltranspeptidase / glutathione hydrolase